MRRVKIGDLFELEKGSLQSSKCTEGEYDFITASKEWKTHNKYSHDTEALIFAAMASGSLGRTHYVNGKFITSDLCYILTPKDSEKYPINLKFYHFVFNSLRDEIVKNTKSGTSKESINQTNLRKYEIPYFGIKQQNVWIERLLQTKSIKQDLEEEIQTQQTLLKKLRQAILQEAIEGKLTKEWREKNPDVESASVLLEKIKQEKERLVKEKKIKKQKPLPPISEDEVPFAIPDSWVWCRFGEIIYENPRNGYSPKAVDFKTETKTLKLGAITYGFFDENQYKYINKKIDKNSFLWLEEGDILIQRSNSLEYVGMSGIFCGNSHEYIYPDLIMKAKTSKHVDNYFILKNLQSPLTRKYFQKNASGSQKSMPKINQSIVVNTLLPLPPLAEEKEIVKKIEHLFTLCDRLEKEIETSKKSSEELMQAVLKEAFEEE